MCRVLVSLALLASAPAWAGNPYPHPSGAPSSRQEAAGSALLRTDLYRPRAASPAQLCGVSATGLQRTTVARCIPYRHGGEPMPT